MSIRKAALIELYDSHDVNLYSQLLFLKEGGYETTLICSDKLRKEAAGYDAGQVTQFYAISGKRGRSLWAVLRRIRDEIIARGIETVILNTAHGNTVRNFCLLSFPHGVRFYGTLHGVNKLRGSLTQKLISRRIRQYFLLNDYMLETALSMPHKGLNFSVFYPIFHPDFNSDTGPDKKGSTIWIGIPGGVEYSRRDYLSLLTHFAAITEKPDLRFLLLGNAGHTADGNDFQEKVLASGLEQYFLFFNTYVDNAVFHAYIKNCDAIMPLIHPVNADMEKYVANQISGSFNLAIAYQVRLLMHEHFWDYEDFRHNALFYNLENLSSFLAHLPAAIRAAGSWHPLEKWSFAVQSSRYLNFLARP